MQRLTSLPIKIALIYLSFSLLWILGSDWLVFSLPNEFHPFLQTTKGWFFVLITSLLLYILLKRDCLNASILETELNDATIRLTQSITDKQALFDSLPISVWEEDFSDAKKYIDQSICKETDLRSWLDQHPEEVACIASKVKILSIGGSTLSMFRAESKDDLLANLSNIFSQESISAFKEELITFYNGEYYFKTEAPQKRLDGSSFMTSTSISMVPGHEKNWGRVLVTIEDITERTDAQNAVDGFFDQEMNIHVIASTDGTILRANQGFKSLLGYEPEELAGQSFLTLIHPDDLDITLAEMEKLSSGEKTFNFENRYRNKQGNYRCLTWAAIAPHGSNIIYAVASDITERQNAETYLRRAASVYKSTSEGILITDLDGTIKEVNQAFCNITGYTENEVKGRNASLLSSGRHDEAFYQTIWKSLQTSQAWQGEIWNRKKNGVIYPEFLTINAVQNNAGIITDYVGVFSDVSNLKQTEDQLNHLTTHDPLTGLINRTLFIEHLEHALQRAKRSNKLVAVFLIDIDNFKNINDSLGFPSGDTLLQGLSDRLRSALREEDTIARISGDEFAVIIEGLSYSKESSQMADNLLQHIKEPFYIQENKIQVTASIGISLYPHDADNSEVLTRNADSALIQAKESGRNNFQFYTESLTSAAFEHLFIESALRSALDQNEFHLVYQPQINLETNQLIGMETLLRWQHPDVGLIPPSRFIPIAERAGLINDIGTWVLENACTQGKAWLDKGYDIGRIAVNVAGPQITQRNLQDVVSSILQKTQFPTQHLELEVTESFVMKQTDEAIELLRGLQNTGIEIAIDDFGTGYSSLSYLKKLPIDKLKIDQSFISGIVDNSDDSAITDAIISLGYALSLTTIAEGVETQEQADALKVKGCQQAQGYLYSRPLSAEQLEHTFLETQHLNKT